MIGYKEASTERIRLRKLQLSLSVGLGNAPTTFDAEKWLTCRLLDAMDNQGVRKFVVQEPGSTSNAALKLWIFSPDLSISSSIRSYAEYVRMAKVLWQDWNPPRGGENENLNGSALAEGELRLCHGELGLLRSRMEQSGTLLPEGARTFQEWHVGLLERFIPSDIRSTSNG